MEESGIRLFSIPSGNMQSEKGITAWFQVVVDGNVTVAFVVIINGLADHKWQPANTSAMSFDTCFNCYYVVDIARVFLMRDDCEINKVFS